MVIDTTRVFNWREEKQGEEDRKILREEERERRVGDVRGREMVAAIAMSLQTLSLSLSVSLT